MERRRGRGGGLKRRQFKGDLRRLIHPVLRKYYVFFSVRNSQLGFLPSAFSWLQFYVQYSVLLCVRNLQLGFLPLDFCWVQFYVQYFVFASVRNSQLGFLPSALSWVQLGTLVCFIWDLEVEKLVFCFLSCKIKIWISMRKIVECGSNRPVFDYLELLKTEFDF
ncbi:hypothetical protein VNO80_01030 [Phaseolus coccineus]|uniref:Uncharacterized protein n=1 Tax=Phaseolus coccineus TaxID=3886 RepID=A0AAN9P0N9_PHACN